MIGSREFNPSDGLKMLLPDRKCSFTVPLKSKTLEITGYFPMARRLQSIRIRRHTMKKLIISLAIIFIVFASFSLHQEALGETNGQCRGYRIVSLGDRYEDVLSKCGDPDDYSYFVNGFGVRVAIELKYDRDAGQYPVFFYFNGRGICARIRFGSERK
jgi:hypothetical protein